MDIHFDIPDVINMIGREPQKGSLPISVLHRALSSSRGLLVVAPEFGVDALSTMVVNKLRGTMQVCAFKLRSSNSQHFEALAAKLNIAPFEGSTANSNFDRFVGKCNKVICHQETCFIKL